MVVSSVRRELRERFAQYDLIEDCLAGEQQVKYRRMKYLPQPNPEDVSVENVARYNAYITRANFYGVAAKTQVGLRGQVFLRDPLVEVPTLLEPVIEDATGSGVPLQQLAQDLVDRALAFGRVGLFCDYPDMSDVGGASLADVEKGEARPMLKVVGVKQAINWRVKKRGAKIILSMVVFEEDAEVEDDGFDVKTEKQWRVLRLINDVYTQEIYKVGSGLAAAKTFQPKDSDGKYFDEIPFWFIGSVTNDPSIDPPPMYDLCSTNMGHYRNSADYEESVYQIGQPTLWVSGLTEKWLKDVLGGVVRLGSLGGLALPANGEAGILQAEPNSLAKEAMDQKEAQMVAQGAKLIEASQTQRTATEATYDNISEASILSTVAKNVGAAVQAALKFGARFVGQDSDKIAYELNTEFDLVNLTPEQRKALIADYQAGLITWTEARDSLRRAGIANLPDAEAKKETEEEDAKRMDAAAAEAGKMAKAVADNSPEAEPGV